MQDTIEAYFTKNARQVQFQDYFVNCASKIMVVKYAKRMTHIAFLLSRKIKKLKYEVLLLEEMVMLLQEQMQYVQVKASRK